VLAILLDGTTYAFSIVLGIVLLGIALGRALVSPLMSRNLPWVGIYTMLQTGVAALALIGVVEFARIQGIMDRIELLSGPLRPLVERHYGWMIGVPTVAILPPMLLLGASFPIAARIVVSGTRHAGRDLGVLYAGNTAGAILGSWVAGFFLLPALGSQAAIVALSAINGALALALALASGPGRVRMTSAVAGLILGSIALMVTFAPNMYYRVVASRFPGQEIVWVGEGQETSVAVLRDPEVDALRMYMNGQHQGGDEPNMVGFHRLLGHLPMIVHPDPQDVLIVGLGGGVTAGALSLHQPRGLDVVELSETVVQGSRYFRHVNADILSFPNLHLKIDDGRNHLLLTDRTYDVITADVIHPRNAGSAVLYSREYYELARRALKPGGIMVQWLEDRGENPDNLTQRKLMARTFLSAFPHVTLWAYGALMIGSAEPIMVDEQKLVERWERRNFDRALADTGLQWPESIMSFYDLGDRELREWAEFGRNPSIMTDDHPYVEYFLSLPGGRGVGRRAGGPT
jgi:spermidine synthase